MFQQRSLILYNPHLEERVRQQFRLLLLQLLHGGQETLVLDAHVLTGVHLREAVRTAISLQFSDLFQDQPPGLRGPKIVRECDA